MSWELDRIQQVAGGFSASEPGDLPLLRPEALEAASDTGFGKPIALYPLRWAILSLGLLVMIVAFAALLVTGNYSRKETVTGIVRTVGQETRVVASLPGVVAHLAVVEGQRVRAGDPLLTVTTARTAIDGRPIDHVALESIDQEIAGLEARLAAADAAAELEQDGRRSRLLALSGEMQAARTIQQANQQRLDAAAHALARIEPLAERGFVSGESIRRRQDEIIALRQGIAEAQGRQASLAGQIGELHAEQGQHPHNLMQQKGQLLDQMARARREREAYAAQRGYIIRAPAGGTVTALQVGRGQAVDPQRPLMTIAAAGGGATAELYVPSRAIGFLEPGQRVRVRYDAFPYQRFGTADGRVTSVSAAVLRPEEVQAPVEIGEPVYRVLVALERDRMAAYGRSYPVQPGFSLSADIVLEDRSFAAWLLDPILSLRGRM